MPQARKRGRKPRVLSTGEKLHLEEFADQLRSLVEKKGRRIPEIAKEIGVCRASLYNYLDKTDLASNSVLERAYRKLGFKFSYMDFSIPSPEKRRHKPEPAEQGTFPFLESIGKENIEVLRAKPVKSENALEVTVQIRFGT
jgi:predicted transcriptional regulator